MTPPPCDDSPPTLPTSCVWTSNLDVLHFGIVLLFWNLKYILILLLYCISILSSFVFLSPWPKIYWFYCTISLNFVVFFVWFYCFFLIAWYYCFPLDVIWKQLQLFISFFILEMKIETKMAPESKWKLQHIFSIGFGKWNWSVSRKGNKVWYITRKSNRNWR